MSACNLRQQARPTAQMEGCEPQGLPIRRKSLVPSSFSSSLSSTGSSPQFSRELNWSLKTGKPSSRAANPSAMDTADKTSIEPHSPAHRDCAQFAGADTYLDACDCSVAIGVRSLSLPPWLKSKPVDLRRRKAQQLKRMARQRNLTLAQNYAREYGASPERNPLESPLHLDTLHLPSSWSSLVPLWSTSTPTCPIPSRLVSALVIVPKLPTPAISEPLNDTAQPRLPSFEHMQRQTAYQLGLTPRSIATPPRPYNYKSSYWQHRSRERININLGPKGSLELQERPFRPPVRSPGPVLELDAQPHLPPAQEAAPFVAGKLESAAPEKAPRRILSVSKLFEFSASQSTVAYDTRTSTRPSTGPARKILEPEEDYAQSPQSPTFGPSMSSDGMMLNGPGIHSVLSHDSMNTSTLLGVTKPKRRPTPFNFSLQSQQSSSFLAKSMITTAMTPTTAISCVTKLLQEPCLTPGPYTSLMSAHTPLDPEEQDRQSTKKSRRIWDHRRLIPKLKSSIASSSSASSATASPTVSNFSSFPASNVNSPLNFYFSNASVAPSTPITPSPYGLEPPRTRTVARSQGHSHSRSADSSFMHMLSGTMGGDADKQASDTTATTTTKPGSTIFYSAPVSLCPVESRPQSPELGCPIESIALPKDYMTRPLDSIRLPWSVPLPLTPPFIQQHQQRRPSDGAFNKDPTPSSYAHPSTSSAPSSPKSIAGSSIGRKKSFHEKLFGKKAKKIFLSMESLSSLPSLPYSNSSVAQYGMSDVRESLEMDRTVYYHDNDSGNHDYYQNAEEGDWTFRGGQRLQEQQDYFDENQDHEAEMVGVSEKDDPEANEHIWKVMSQWRRWKKNHLDNMKR
ncbi:hypothetical protein BGZ67_004148 [Mortierella alpina]|nr:hypothetical protein BGZ67_004148 [Mortierella alpina]